MSSPYTVMTISIGYQWAGAHDPGGRSGTWAGNPTQSWIKQEVHHCNFQLQHNIMTRQEGKKVQIGQEDNSPKEDVDCTNMPKAKNTTCDTKFPVDQSTKISTKDEARSELLQ